jgi:hypothetical protein
MSRERFPYRGRRRASRKMLHAALIASRRIITFLSIVKLDNARDALHTGWAMTDSARLRTSSPVLGLMLVLITVILILPL